MEKCVFSVGMPLLDFTAYVDEEFLKKHGLESNDAILNDKLNSELYEELQGSNFEITVGGSITNTARVIQKMSKYANTSCHVGCIGNDKEGAFIKQTLIQENVNFMCEELKTAQTGRCVILTTNLKNRSMVTSLGAAQHLSEKILLNKHIQIAHKNARFIYTAAFIFKIPEIALKLAKDACICNKTFVFNIGAPYLCEQYVCLFRKIFPLVNILLGNESEAFALAKIFGYPNQNLNEIATYLQAYDMQNKYIKGRIVVITRGAEPVIVSDKNGLYEFPVEKMDQEEIKDTTGAGDVFAGGFLSQLLQDKPLEDCIKTAIAIARESMKCTGINLQDKFKLVTKHY